jgi:hypothetical protein
MTAHVAEASIVFTAATLIRRSVPAKVDPGFETKPAKGQDECSNHGHRNISGWNRIGGTVFVVLAEQVPASWQRSVRYTPPVKWTTDEPAKIDMAMAETKSRPSIASQPPRPTPNSRYRIHDRSDKFH